LTDIKKAPFKVDIYLIRAIHSVTKLALSMAWWTEQSYSPIQNFTRKILNLSLIYARVKIVPRDYLVMR